MSDLFDDEDGVEIQTPIPKKPVLKESSTDLLERLVSEANDAQDDEIPEGTVSYRELLNRDYREYAMYVIEQRAIPSLVDGMKPVQRMLYHAMQTLYKKGEVKCSEVAGTLPSFGYAHGEVSAQDAVCLMGKAWRNNLPMFIGHGNFGSRSVHESASPRYIYVSNNPVAEEIFSDFDVIPKNEDSAVPSHYLPIVPMVLVNGTDGVAVGFATSILMRSLSDVISMVTECLKTGDVKSTPLPSFPNFRGKVLNPEPSKYIIQGLIEQGTGKKSNTFTISELPWGYDRRKYVEFLAELVETKSISDFNDNCGKNGFNFTVKMTPEQREVAEKDLIKFFDLSVSVTENYTLIDQSGNLIVFDSVPEIVKHFCRYRVVKRQQQINFNIDKLQSLIVANEAKQKFIETVIKTGVDVISKWTLKQLKQFVSDMGYVDYTQQLIGIPIYGFTEDEVADLKSKTEKLRTEMKTLQSTDPSKSILKELSRIK